MGRGMTRSLIRLQASARTKPRAAWRCASQEANLMLQFQMGYRQAIKMMRQQGMLTKGQAKKLRHLLDNNREIPADHPLAPMVGAVFLIQLKPGNLMLH